MTKVIPHPAKFSEALEPSLMSRGLVLDPFAGTGRVGRVVTGTAIGVELEMEWARQGREHGTLMVVGNSVSLPFKGNAFDAIVTSPTYGNRMADHHNAKDGSRRRTYKHQLGRNLTDGNTGQMHWGEEYRKVHRRVYAECIRVLKPGGAFVLNISDYIKDGEIVAVSEWHTRTLMGLGLEYSENIDIKTPRMRFGANRKRVPYEHIRRFSKPGRQNRTRV